MANLSPRTSAELIQFNFRRKIIIVHGLTFEIHQSYQFEVVCARIEAKSEGVLVGRGVKGEDIAGARNSDESVNRWIPQENIRTYQTQQSVAKPYELEILVPIHIRKLQFLANPQGFGVEM